MKINGPNHSRFNPYQNQINKQAEVKKSMPNKDELQISSQGMKLQENAKPEAERQARVEKIKQAVQNGDYQVDPQKTAQKMIEFWNKRT